MSTLAVNDCSSASVNQTGTQMRSQTVRETPARECTNDCVLRRHLGLLRNSLRPSACENVAQPKVTSRPAQGNMYYCSTTSCTITPALALCTTCKPRLCLSLPLSSLLHGSWSAPCYTQHATASLQLGQEKSRVESQFPTENMPVACSSRPISTVGTSGDGILFCYARRRPRTRGL